jgi:two-component system, response regulator RegA
MLVRGSVSVNAPKQRAVLIVDDDELMRRALVRDFRSRGWQAYPSATAEEAVALARSVGIDLVIVDLHLEAASGLEVLQRLRDEFNKLKMIVLTGFGSIPTAVKAMQLGACHYLTKPTSAAAILSALEQSSEVTVATPEPDLPSLARAEWEHLQRALAESGGNISEAARRLHISRRTLQRKLRKLPPFS